MPSIFSLILAFAGCQSSAWAGENQFGVVDEGANIQEIYVPYDALTVRQKELLATYQKSKNFVGTGQQFWNYIGKDNTLQRAFFGTTEAMEHRYAKGGVKVIDLVDSITDIAGIEKGEQPTTAEQFNIAIKWKAPPKGVKKVRDLFDTKDFGNRVSAYHPGESGVQEKKPGGGSGLHLLFAEDGSNNGHAVIAFRKVSVFEAVMTFLHLGFLVPGGLKKGHFSEADADLGAIGPEKDHGKPINNLEWFAKTYDDPRVLAFSQRAPLGQRAWADTELMPEVTQIAEKDLWPAPPGFGDPTQHLGTAEAI